MRLLDVDAVLSREKVILRDGPPTKVWGELDDKTAKYVILSHRWGNEVNYDEMTRLMSIDENHRNDVKQRGGYEKILKSCKQAQQDGYKWIWIDTCCIDKRSSSELSEAINSMYRWYHNSQKCYAYLHDVEDSIFPSRQDFSKFHKAGGWPEWFSRGWTLQELIAPRQVEFFNKDWVSIGDRKRLTKTLEKITRVPLEVLEEGWIPKRLCVAELMSWAADRTTTRVEDRAYSLLGLFGVNLPILYGEGEKAFQRLQLEILRVSGDHSIFAWNPKGQFSQLGGVLAGSPSDFRGCLSLEKVEVDQFIQEITNYRQNGRATARSRGSSKFACSRSRHRSRRLQLSPILVTNMGIQVCLPVIPHRDSESVFRAILACRDYYGNLISIDLKTFDLSSYKIPAAWRFRTSRPEFKPLYLACSSPDFHKECHDFKVDERHASYHGFTRCGTFPHELTGDTVTISSLSKDPVIIVYTNDDTRSRFAVVLGYYLGGAFVHVACDECSVDQEVPWTDFSKRLYDMLWVAPVEHCANSGVKCAHLPRSIWDARVVWHVTGNMQTSVVVDVEQCPGCCIGPRECTTTSNDRDTIDTPGFMQTVHNVRGLKLDGKDVWFCECSGERIALGDYGDYSNGSFRPCGNIFEDMRGLGIDPADSAYHPVVSRVSSGADALHHKQDQHIIAVGHRGHHLILHSPKALSLPNNQQLVLLLKALSMRLANKHLVTIIIQCSNLNCVDEEGNRKEAGGASASLTGSDSMEPGVLVPLCTIASPQVWRREPACARIREQFRSIREHFYTLVNLCRPSGAENGRESTRMNRGAVKFLSNIFGLESLNNYVGNITFFKELHSMLETRMQRESICIRKTDAAGSRDGPSARRATSTWSPFRSRAALNPGKETVVPPLLEKCRAFNPLVGSHRYLVARQQVRCEIKSISQTLGVGLLEYIHTTIRDACEDEIIQDTAHARRVDIHSTLQEIKTLQTILDTTDDEDEQRALEEDVTGKVLWISWCGILSELEQLLAEARRSFCFYDYCLR
ncbi:heterokaryon incompatibility protein-domain-containing protein [Pisolithus albus]|nr:heterokaryon incompatibility protein-domain-containing protein [Pisolithus albus]